MSKWSVAKETVATLSEQAPDHGADVAGMLEALISTAWAPWQLRKMRLT